ncbi:MAG TPA: DUF2442 domain-containing protein [Caulobacterales bacterium]|jgi:hypothetical protein|nr:DUF2442 domain-containing protein [Caulobacterales bacterium]
MASLDEINRANARGRAQREKNPAALSARYDARSGKIVIALASGLEIAFAPFAAQGLEHASAADLKTIEITPSGLGLHFPKIDADIYIPALLEGFLGSKAWSASRLGAAGGRAKSASKREASRQNGKLGGRPRKVKAQ